jgi:hypothetical protein
MPQLTRRRDPEAHQETWRIFYGDVHVGTIARGVGNPNAASLGQAGTKTSLNATKQKLPG